ncbi:MAG: hypothetical protein CME70_14260 [Halobacteriovorax sp.]|nr:hypothetical protein [Halobacteriovorax sp.]|tara:strand:+ start:289038 stop:289403 length:366 start_codon:yes stop_codon:yes gene_type:complete
MLKLIKVLLLSLFLSQLASADINKYLPLKKSHLPAVYKVIGKSVAELEKTKNEALLGKILDVYIQHHKFDKTYYFYEILAPFYGKNKPMVLKALKKYKKKDRELAKQNLDIALNELINGNG